MENSTKQIWHFYQHCNRGKFWFHTNPMSADDYANEQKRYRTTKHITTTDAPSVLINQLVPLGYVDAIGA